MSWQERIRRHQEQQEAERQRINQEAERIKREALEAKKPEMLRIVQERVPPLLDALKQFNCEALLTQMRDEVWKMGTVSVEPDRNNLTYDTPIGARVILRAEWPVFCPLKIFGGEEYGRYSRTPASIGRHEEVLIINAFYGKILKLETSISLLEIGYDRSCKNILLCVDPGGRFDFPSASDEEFRHSLDVRPGRQSAVEIRAGAAAADLLEEALVKYCLKEHPEKLIERRRADLVKLFEEGRWEFEDKDDRKKLRKIAREYGLEGVYDSLKFKRAWQSGGCLFWWLNYLFDRR